MRKVLIEVCTSFCLLDGVPRHHAEMMNEHRSCHAGGEACLLNPPEKIYIFAAAIAESFIKQSHPVKDVPPNYHTCAIELRTGRRQHTGW